MSLPDYSMRQLLEAGVHFGHQSHRWNPKMAEYIFGARNNIHIIDLAQSVPMLHKALQAVSDTVAKGGRILFVGTKRQAQDAIAEAAKKSAQYFVNSRWLGGTLTNWKTISGSISRLRKLDEMLASNEAGGYTKKERLTLTRERDKLNRALGGIKDMGGLPDLVFVIDTNKEDIAIKEARRLNVPVARLSGGQRQAIAVARTVHSEADILLLDEPLAAMGAKEGALILDLIARVKAEGRVSMIMVLHNYVHVLTACDRVNLIQDGVISLDKPTSETSVEELTEIVVEEYRRARMASQAEARARS